jgi:hypothetical protein|uniref:Uncharacterized protein n=1 Tax=Picea glauca TaxID=3330 RepID=A0A117NIW7_PICGL|nr:hypothetical protein ABT39_MTgene447 [Picea glauca]QHR88194.1 hypothetical protein Q903MT_gene2207 [Picea sitchensis]
MLQLPLHDHVLIQEHHPHILPLLKKVLPRRMELLMDKLDPELEGMPLRVLIQLDQMMV